MRTEHLTGLLSEIEAEIDSVREYYEEREAYYQDLVATFSITTVWESEGDNVHDPIITTIVHRLIENLEITEGDAEPVEFTDDQQTLINQHVERWTI